MADLILFSRIRNDFDADVDFDPDPTLSLVFTVQSGIKKNFQKHSFGHLISLETE